MRKEDEPIVVEQTFNRSCDKVWKAITEADEMRQWFFDNIPAFKAEAGFETQFTVHNEGRDFLHLWKVTDVVPGKKLEYDWRFEGYAGDGFSRFELFEQADSTKLRLTFQARESFPQDVPEFKRESGVAGWDYFIRTSLKAYLEKVHR